MPTTNSQPLIIVEDAHIGDVAAMTRVHLAAFPEFFLSSLGHRFISLYYRCLIKDRNAIAQIARVGESGEAIGFAAGAVDPRGFYRRLLTRDGIRFAAAAAPAVIRRPSIAIRVARATMHHRNNPQGGNLVGLFSVAVDPRFQGRSIGRELVDRFTEAAAALGGHRIRLTTDAARNDAVNRFYQSAGFTCVGQFTTPEGRMMNDYERLVGP